MKAIFKKNKNGVVFAENLDWNKDGDNAIEFATPSLNSVKARLNGVIIVGSCYPEPIFDENYRESAEGILIEAMERIAYHDGLKS